MADVEALKREAGIAACKFVKTGMKVGLGTGSTVKHTVIELGRQIAEEGLEIVRTCRDRYDGRVRNPFNEYECGHWYARAMASYGLIQGLSGVVYDAVDRVLHIKPTISGDFRSFLSTATGYGTVGVKEGAPFVEIVEGEIPYQSIEYKKGVSSPC